MTQQDKGIWPLLGRLALILGILASLATVVSLLLLLNRPGVATGPVNSTPFPSVTPSLMLGHVSRQVEVSASMAWQDSQVFVHIRDHVKIVYISGLWTYSPNQPPSDGNGPAEQFICTQHYPASQCDNPVNDAVEGSLVGRIGTQLLAIGDSLEVVAQQSGDIEMMINDYGLYDNSGSLLVQIDVN